MQLKKLLKAGCKYLWSADYRFLINAGFGLYNHMPDEEYLKRKFKACMGKELNLENPQTFNEKLQWLKLYDRKPEYTMMVDKVKVRDYIAETIGEEYLIPLLGVWEDPEDIDFDALPNQFVLKCNHNSGLGMCICKDKTKLDIPKVKRELKKGLAQDYYLTGREWPYKDVPRRIIAEKYMVDESGTELKDYKVMCFNSVPRIIQLHRGRFGDHTLDFYDSVWKRVNFTWDCPQSEISWDRPYFLDEMLKLSEKLSLGIPELRVDWYFAEKHLYFGELTFSPTSGFSGMTPEQWDYTLGSWIELL